MVVEGLLREFLGPARLVGNHIVIDSGDGHYALYAHLKRESIRVQEGDIVNIAEHLADCGNSGNSSEPHLHFQVMDHPNVLVAAGLPIGFSAVGTSRPGLPANHELLIVEGTEDSNGGMT